VTNDPVVNAMTIGAKTPIVIVRSSLVGSYEPNETQTVLAHELGHVLSEHYYYTTALVLMRQFIEGTLPKSLLFGLPVRGMYLALLEWARAAELSADRAAALVMADPLEPCRVLMRIAGGALPGMSFDAFMKQAADYDGEDDLFSRHSRFWIELSLTHPIAVRRVREMIEWVQSGDYDRIVDGSYPRRGQEPPSSIEFDAAVAHYRDRFSRFLDRTAGNVQDLGKQFSDWLNKRPGGEGADDEDD
jgi:Zn-dependent protease with chaperone function